MEKKCVLLVFLLFLHFSCLKGGKSQVLEVWVLEVCQKGKRFGLGSAA